MNETEAHKKKKGLLEALKRLDRVLVAFSGGADSSFLLGAAHEVLGEGVTAATAQSAVHSARERKNARAFTGARGIPHVFFPSRELELSEFVANGPDRCYHCKRAMMRDLKRIAGLQGIPHVIHGANRDDLGDYRPGMRAAEEAGVGAPLLDAGLTKEDIRFLSKEIGLPSWNVPPMACLASRIPYGRTIAVKDLEAVDEAEELLLGLGFSHVRVRHYGSLARIEIAPSEFEKLVRDGLRNSVIKEFQRIGFNHVTIDLEGYVQGKMNRDLNKRAAGPS